MAEPVTWINVVDSAVKIGLGALLGGGFGVWVAWLNNKSQAGKAYLERRRLILEGVLEAVDGAANAASLFWANLSNAVFKRDKQERLSDAEYATLGTLQEKFFTAFTALNSSAAKLLLLGETSAEEKLSGLRIAFDALFKIAVLENSNCNKAVLEQHKQAISSARKEFYKELSAAYKHNV